MAAATKPTPPPPSPEPVESFGPEFTASGRPNTPRARRLPNLDRLRAARARRVVRALPARLDPLRPRQVSRPVRIVAVLVLAFAANPARAADAPPAELAVAARLLLKQHCAECHKPGGRSTLLVLNPFSLLRAERSVVVAGRPDRSQLLELVEDGSMPPGKRPKLTRAESDLLKRWIAAGALVPERLDEDYALDQVLADAAGPLPTEKSARPLRQLSRLGQAGRPGAGPRGRAGQAGQGVGQVVGPRRAGAGAGRSGRRRGAARRGRPRLAGPAVFRRRRQVRPDRVGSGRAGSARPGRATRRRGAASTRNT